MNSIYPSGKSHIRRFPDIIDHHFFVDDILNHQATFIKRELFDKHGLYDEKYKIAADYEKWVIYSLDKCSFQHLDLIVNNFMLNGISSTQTDLLMSERLSIQDAYYQKQRIYYLFNLIPLLKIETS